MRRDLLPRVLGSVGAVLVAAALLFAALAVMSLAVEVFGGTV